MRYCTTCRTHYEGDGPPYAVQHVAEDRHLHPVTGEEQTLIVPTVLGWPRETRTTDGALTGYWRESEADALAAHVENYPTLLVITGKEES